MLKILLIIVIVFVAITILLVLVHFLDEKYKFLPELPGDPNAPDKYEVIITKKFYWSTYWDGISIGEVEVYENKRTARFKFKHSHFESRGYFYKKVQEHPNYEEFISKYKSL